VGFDEEGTVAIIEPVAPGHDIERRASHAPRGSILIGRGRQLTAIDIGLLAAAGLTRVGVVRKPRVLCLLAEAPAAAGMPQPQALSDDPNGPLLQALIERDGGVLTEQRTVKREQGSLRRALGLPGADLIIVAGATGVPPGDPASAALAEAGTLAIPSVAVRHAEASGLGIAAGVPVFLLPPAPAACLWSYELFAGRAVRRLGGRSGELPFPRQHLRLTRKIVSELSSMEVRPVRRTSEDWVEPFASIAEGGLRSAADADGFVLVPEGSEGYPHGAAVVVYLYDSYDRTRS
jgi:molybdopterin molybdotransferase